jgi:hypothetical protein
MTAGVCTAPHRWRNYLDPNLDLSKASKEEDARIMEVVNVHGTNWETIKAYFPGRTAAWPKYPLHRAIG